MHSFLKKHHRFLFFAAWLIINLIQAWTTELFDDEAYYWVYSKNLAWGYFDHPPMIAVLIKAGYFIFKNEFGLRLFIVLMNAATIFFVSRLIDNRNDKLFYAISTSIVVAQIGGMIAVPDLPLLFFVTLFFLMYKKFVQKMNFVHSLMLGISIALMLYTKYHGILIVLFTLLSNFKLLARYQTYTVAAIALILFAPHLYWQYTHDFISVQFHLFERTTGRYQLSFTLEYIASQLVLAGPLMGWMLIWASVRYRPVTETERALRFTLIGFYIFFLMSSFMARVEANWTLPAFIAMIVLGHQHLNNKPRVARWIYKMIPLTLVLVFAMRIYMMVNIKTSDTIIKNEFHQNREWISIISKKANGLPVVFVNSYQRPSKYWFYHGKPASAINTPNYRRNNYNFWPLEDSCFGKAVFVVGGYDTIALKNMITGPRLKKTGFAIVPFYYSFMKVRFLNIENKVSSDTITSSFDIEVPEQYLSHFQKAPFDTASIQLAIIKINDTIRYFPSGTRLKAITQRSSRLSVDFPAHLPKGNYDGRLGISSAISGHPTLNSPSFRIRVK